MPPFAGSEYEELKQKLKKEFPNNIRLHESLDQGGALTTYLVTQALLPGGKDAVTGEKAERYRMLYDEYMAIYSKIFARAYSTTGAGEMAMA